MKIEPSYTTIGNLFRYRPMFFIPKYQRAYAWESESVSDFIKDLHTCFEKRKSNSPIDHFFGGILSVKHSVEGVVNQHEYEIIDGQQRLATFTLLVCCLIDLYKDLKDEAGNMSNTQNEKIVQKRIEKLSERFQEFTQEVQRDIKSYEVLKLSKADHLFYNQLIRGLNPNPQRDSHEKMLHAYDSISKKLKQIVDSVNSIEEKIDDLEILENVLENDFTILHMVTPSRDDAFRLFQVVNDRGTNLTDGDLLRAKTLELLEGFDVEQNAVERMWDEILIDKPSDTTDYLNWIYESYKGSRPRRNTLFDMFLDVFFPQHHQESSLSRDDARKIHSTVNKILQDVKKCRKLVGGQWLYDRKPPITGWDVSRLNILVVELKHTLSIPLLLAASNLDERVFAELVHTIEKAFFRYKIICNQHVTPLKKVYSQECLAIRDKPDCYQTSSIRAKLQKLIKDKAYDSKFENELKNLEYKDSGGTNKPLKYFLMIIDYYYEWHKDGDFSQKTKIDKTRVYDFAATSIEHVYPQNSSSEDPELEPLKNKIGNLIIMDSTQNAIGGNKNFTDKKHLYQNSTVLMAQEISSKNSWTKADIEEHEKSLISVALKIFSF